MTCKFRLVTESMRILFPDRDRLRGIFYRRLLEKFPRISERITEDTREQLRVWFYSTLQAIADHMDDPDELEGALKELVGEYPPEMLQPIVTYGLRQTMLESIEEFFGADWNPELEVAWDETMGLVAAIAIDPASQEKPKPRTSPASS